MLVQLLRTQHRDLSALSDTLRALGMSEAGIVAPLAELLREPDADLRVQAALALDERLDQQATAALIRALGDENANVRFHAIEAPGKLRAAEAVAPSLAVVETRDFYLAFPALDALAQINDSSVALHLTWLLDDDCWTMSCWARR